MKNIIKNNLIHLPRSFRIWWGKCFLYMLGKIGTDEFTDDMLLFNELKLWVDTKGKPNSMFKTEHNLFDFDTKTNHK